MNDFESDLEQTIESVSQAIQNWNERSPTLLASTLAFYSIPTLLEIILRTPETRNEEQVHQALATMVLARFAKEDGDLSEFKDELWEVYEADDERLPILQTFLRHVQEISIQQMHHQPSQGIYIRIRKVVQELLIELRQKPLRRKPLRKKRRNLSIKLAQTAELPELSQLTFQPLDHRVEEKIYTSTLSTLPSTLRIPAMRLDNEVILHLDKVPQWEHEEADLLYWLPEIYDLLENWDDDSSPLWLAELLHPLTPATLLRYSSYVLPHPNQEFYLRYIGILVHLKLITETPLPYLNESLRQLVSLEEPLLEPILPAIFYYIYCSSHSFYAIQEEAIKQLGFQLSYLYHLISQEWHKNKLINNFTKATLSQSEQRAVKNLSPLDWEFIFLLLHRGWARSVIRDVYGVFHGSSTFANQIVQPDTSVGFGDVKQTGKGISLTLATQQISDMLKTHKKAKVETGTKEQQFEQFAQERFKREVLKKETRPTLNVSSLKRLERYLSQGVQRAEQAHLSQAQATYHLVKEILLAFSHLSLDRIGWLVYDVVKDVITSSEQVDFALLLEGLTQAILQVFVQEIYPRREREAWQLAEEIWSALFYSLLDQGFLKLGEFESTAELRSHLVQVVDAQRAQHLDAPRKAFFGSLN